MVSVHRHVFHENTDFVSTRSITSTAGCVAIGSSSGSIWRVIVTPLFDSRSCASALGTPTANANVAAATTNVYRLICLLPADCVAEDQRQRRPTQDVRTGA